jgi:hypothetical protein
MRRLSRRCLGRVRPTSTALVSLIALINTYNRMNVIIQQPAGDYQPGQWK